MEQIPAEDRARMAQVPALRSATVIEPLSGGLTNRNYRVETAAGPVVARVSDNSSALLAIDRDHEYANSRAAAEAGAGAEVLDYAPAVGILVVRWIEGRTFTDDDLRAGANLPRVAAACRRLHAGPRFVNDFDMLDLQQQYLRVVQEHGFRLPDGYLDLAAPADRIRSVLRSVPVRTVPCNNDLLAGNFIDDGERLWLVDYEYAGNNDPCFELGNIWSEAGLPAESLEALVTAYYGTPRPAKVARARLLGLMSKYGWTLWAAIQQSVSPIDFDFWSWGMEKYDRAVAEFSSDEFDALLKSASGDDDAAT